MELHFVPRTKRRPRLGREYPRASNLRNAQIGLRDGAATRHLAARLCARRCALGDQRPVQERMLGEEQGSKCEREARRGGKRERALIFSSTSIIGSASRTSTSSTAIERQHTCSWRARRHSKSTVSCESTAARRAAARPSAGYDLSNRTYPSWMESRWDKIELELFLAAGYTFELYATVAAVALLALSVLLFRFQGESWFIDATDVLPAEV